MSFLRRLADHTIAAPPSLMPRLPSRYESVVPQGDADAPVEIESERTQPTPRASAPDTARSEGPAARARATMPRRPAAAVGPERGAARTPGPPTPARSAEREAGPPEHSVARDGVSAPDAATAAAPSDAGRRGAEFVAGRRVAGESERGDAATSEAAFRLIPVRPAEPAREQASAAARPAIERGQDHGAAEAPTVTVHIGRIEVRAVSESAPPRPPSAPRASRLDAYLTARNRERR
jgi:hypothetical protein